MKCSHRVRENPETFLFKEEYGAPCSSLPRFTSSSQPSASVLVTALWWCREAESTFPSHSGLGIGRSYPLLFRQDFCPSHSLKLFMSGWGQPRQLLWPIPQLSEVLDPLGCTQHEGIEAVPQPATSMPWSALCLSLRKIGRGPSGALCATAVDVLLLFALCLRQRFLLLDPPSSSLSWARMHTSFWKGDPEHWLLVPSGVLPEDKFWGKGWLLHQRVQTASWHESLGSPALFPSAPDSIDKL